MQFPSVYELCEILRIHERCPCRYRLYPEVQFPVQYLDCLAAAKHLLSQEVLSRYEVDPQHVGIAGDSAGGNLAAAVAQEVKVSPEKMRQMVWMLMKS